jgi:catalase
VTYLMGDRGLPRSWRTMPGYGSHTYQWINAAGERFWVKYHFHSLQGNEEITGIEAEQLAGADADFYRRDLYEAIQRGDFPSWRVSVQVMPYEDATTYRFNPFDLTKVWPHSDYPLIEVGIHTLNENPQNFFAEIEQAAFSPANTVPGIDISPDKMLMARVFSYPDAQRYRVGTNYNELPVNRPIAPVHNYSQDGAARHGFKPADAPVYAPNSFGGPAAQPERAGDGSWESDGALVRSAATLHAEDDDFGQAGTLYREVYDDAAKERFLDTIAGAVSGVKREDIRERAIQYWTNVDASLGRALRARLESGYETPDEAAEYVGVAE